MSQCPFVAQCQRTQTSHWSAISRDSQIAPGLLLCADFVGALLGMVFQNIQTEYANNLVLFEIGPDHSQI